MNAEEFRNRLVALPSRRLDWIRSQKYLPFVVGLMTDRERDALCRWFEDSETRWPHGNGASGFTAMSTVAGFVLGSGLRSLVQCGHYIGFSTLVLGSVFRHMGRENALYSMDVHEKAHAYALEWIARAGLEKQVRCVLRSSDHAENLAESAGYFGRPADSVFIDSSHAYDHTRRELNLWVRALRRGGFVFMHDVSDYAKRFDGTGKGGVRPATLEFVETRQVRAILVESVGDDPVYRDPCGLGILQKL